MNTFYPEIKKNFGFGMMRLPMNGENVDISQTCDMVDAFLAAGFNYFDTAHGYIGGKSELAVKDCLTSRYPRDSYILTDKLSPNFFQTEADIRPYFRSMLEACGVDYFDFFLLHSLTAGNYPHYTGNRAFEIAAELKAEGKVRHVGISFHDTAETLEKILSEQPVIEVVQLQFNYLDYEDAHVQSRLCYEVCVKYGKPVIYDSARFVENAYFIKTREEGYADKSIKEIVKETFSLADGMTMSSKKDGLVNMGGFIATRHEDWYEGAKKYCIPFEGYLTYGGMNGRDMAALAVGLEENTELDNIETRIRQVQYLAARLDEYGIPYQRPVGGHALFIDADRVLANVPKEEFPAQTLAIELYLEAGIRGCEIGYILADRDPVTRENRFGGLDLLRLCIARRVYTNNHMDVIAAALKNVYDRRDSIKHGVRITWETELMRHFTVKLERIED